MKSIIIMSGSFNPPTIAHHKTILAAVETLDAEKGFYVPTPTKGLRYKMRKAGVQYCGNRADRNAPEKVFVAEAVGQLVGAEKRKYYGREREK